MQQPAVSTATAGSLASPTNKILAKERNQFWFWILLAVVIGVAMPGIAKLLVVTLLIWRVWRICRVLAIPCWWTTIYRVCCWLPVLFLIPLIGITSAFQRARNHAERVERGLA